MRPPGKAEDDPAQQEVGLAEAKPVGPLLSEEVANHLADLERRQLAIDAITESRHTLRILQGAVSKSTRNTG
jgi:hypothetical protein